MSYLSTHKEHQFQNRNVLGLPGHVFGRHWHETKWKRVSCNHDDWSDEVLIRWPTENEIARGDILSDRPIVRINEEYWPISTTDLKKVERDSGFPIRDHCAKLVSESPTMPVILEWGCGQGKAVNDLTNDPRIRGKALVFAYSNTWYQRWNEIHGVKFLFFVKEHLPEYFKRRKLEVNIVFTHTALEAHVYGNDLINHLQALASIMAKGGVIVYPEGIRPEFQKIEDVFDIEPIRSSSDDWESSCKMTRK